MLPAPAILTGHASHLDQTCFPHRCLCVRDVSADQGDAAYRTPTRRRLGGFVNPGEQQFSAAEKDQAPCCDALRPISPFCLDTAGDATATSDRQKVVNERLRSKSTLLGSELPFPEFGESYARHSRARGKCTRLQCPASEVNESEVRTIWLPCVPQRRAKEGDCETGMGNTPRCFVRNERNGRQAARCIARSTSRIS